MDHVRRCEACGEPAAGRMYGPMHFGCMTDLLAAGRPRRPAAPLVGAATGLPRRLAA